MAACGDLVQSGEWAGFSMEDRTRYCLFCPLRFAKNPSCSLDFLVLPDAATFKAQMGHILEWIATHDPEWTELNGCLYEVQNALDRAELIPPIEVVQGFFKICQDITPDQPFWSIWNYYVEGKGARAFLRDAHGGAVGQAAEKIVMNLVENASFEGARLRFLAAACAIFNDVAEIRDFTMSQKVFALLSESCRKAILAGCTLEIS